MDRSELVVTPLRRPTGSLPLYVVLHGSGSTPASAARRTGLLPLAAAGRALLLYPQGIGRSWNAGQGCCGAAGASGVDDVGFVLAAVDDAVAELGASPSEVHLVGYSNGGKLALRLAAEHAERWAAVATFAAVPLTPLGAGAPVPLLLAGGTDDRRTPWEGGPSIQRGALAPSVTGAAEAYLAAYGLGGATPERVALARDRVEVSTWRGRSPRSVVRLVAYRGWGHAWPGGGSLAGGSSLLGGGGWPLPRRRPPIELAALVDRFFAERGRRPPSGGAAPEG